MKLQALILATGLALLTYGFTTSGQQASHKQSQADKLFARAKEEDFFGDAACGACHEKASLGFQNSAHAAFVADSKLPANKRGCEGCHGPGGIHQAEENAEVISFRSMSPKESSAACLRCHGETLNPTHWKRNEHAKADLSCVSCHQIHTNSDPGFETHKLNKGKAADPRRTLFKAAVNPKAMLKADEATLCGQCHQPEVAEFRLANHHPVPEGAMVCSDCHSAHPTKGAKAHTTAGKDSCVKCHTEMAGPFVFEHDPVAGHSSDGCKECHRPHGSNNPKMLTGATRGLCGQCHTDKVASHYAGQTCWSAGCHSSMHGSNTNARFLAP